MRTMLRRKWLNACARIGIAVLALLSCLGPCAARAESDGMLRVKLARLGSPSAIEMHADCDYLLVADPAMRIPAGTVMTLAAADGRLTFTVGSRAVNLGDTVHLRRDGVGSVGMQFTSPALSNRFCGDLYFSASGNVITTLLRVYVEDYLYGVVGYELAPSSPLEALKAQAVVARNYALRQKAARAGAACDLTDTGDALSYRGYNAAAEYANVLRAVDDTRGQTLYYEGSPATCYYCDSNGGQIESAANALGTALPYSAVRDDPYDLDGAGAKKTASLRKDAAELAPELTAALCEGMSAQLTRLDLSADPADIHIDAIVDVAPGEALYPEPSRLYASLAFTLNVTGKAADGSAQTAQVLVTVPTYGGLEDWYGLSINDADNETVYISETDRAFEITFRRSGSGLGLSKRGAQVMAKKGFTCAEILEYYYPGTELRRLDLVDAARDGRTSAAEALAGTQPIATARLSQKTRLYEDADESIAALTTLPAGATVDVYAVQGDWAALGSGGTYGFAHTSALTDFALLGATAAQVKNETLAKVGADVDVLQLPVAQAKALAHLSAGDTVRLNGYTDAWAMIATADDIEGYIARDALTLQDEGGSADDGEIVVAPEDFVALLTEDAGLYVNVDDSIAPRQTLSEGGYVQILAYNRAWAYVRTVDGLTGFVKLSALSAVETATEMAAPEAEEAGEVEVDVSDVTIVHGVEYRYVSADALPMFEAADSGSAVLTTLNAGDEVRLGAYNDEWACVRVDGLTGFVLRSGLTEQPPASPGDIEGGTVTVVKGTRYAAVTVDGAPLYPTWDDSQAPLAHLVQGQKVQLGAYNARWACVRVDGVTGFVLVDALDLTADEAPVPDDGVTYGECEAEATARVELYADAALSGEPLAELNKGARLHVYAYNRAVAYVEYDGVRGFVALQSLRKVD